MRGDQLAREWPIIRAIEAIPNGLTAAETVRDDEVKKALQRRSPSKAYSKKWMGFFVLGIEANRFLDI